MSSTRNTLKPYLAINAGDLSQANLVSTATNVLFHDVVTIHLTAVTTTANGTWAVQVSNVPSPGTAANSTDWLTLSIVPPLAFTGTTNPSIGTSFDKFAWNWIRAVYTSSSGTGTVNMLISAVGR